MTRHDRRNLKELLDKLRRKIARFRSSDSHVGEENTKATLIEPLLAALGWDVEEPDEVHREYRKQPADAPVDYALCVSRMPRLFVEAKSLEKNIDDRRWASQILGYATVVGVEWCILTNGDEYLLYNAHAAVDVEEKLFRRIRISDRESETLIEDTLELLAKEMLKEKRLTTLWDAHHVDRQVKAAIESLWGAADPSFVRLIRKHAKGLTQGQIRASLQRGRILLDFPVDSTETTKADRSKRTVRGRLTRIVKPRLGGLPSRSRLEVPLLEEILDRGGSIELRSQFVEVADSLASKFSLTGQQLSAQTKAKKTTIWKNRIRWVRQDLVERGDLDGSDRGVWRITEQGRTRAKREGRRGMTLVDPA